MSVVFPVDEIGVEVELPDERLSFKRSALAISNGRAWVTVAWKEFVAEAGVAAMVSRIWSARFAGSGVVKVVLSIVVSSRLASISIVPSASRRQRP